jgi:hypothetical protein
MASASGTRRGPTAEGDDAAVARRERASRAREALLRRSARTVSRHGMARRGQKQKTRDSAHLGSTAGRPLSSGRALSCQGGAQARPSEEADSELHDGVRAKGVVRADTAVGSAFPPISVVERPRVVPLSKPTSAPDDCSRMTAQSARPAQGAGDKATKCVVYRDGPAPCGVARGPVPECPRVAHVATKDCQCTYASPSGSLVPRWARRRFGVVAAFLDALELVFHYYSLAAVANPPE